ncbi:cupin domain-containing protein [Chloroflexota bacterium]
MKILNLEDLGKGSQRGPVFDTKDGAIKLEARVMVAPVGGPRQKLHYHTDREGWMSILSGEGKEVIEEGGTLKEYSVKAHDIWFVPAKVKHRIENVGNTDLKVLEMFSLPHDFIEVE